MKQLLTSVLFLLILAIPGIINAQFSKGTFSVSPEFSFSAFNYSTTIQDTTYTDEGSTLQLAILPTYFILKNLEVGIAGGINLTTEKSEGIKSSQFNYSIGPLIGYNIPLDEKLSVLARASYTWNDAVVGKNINVVGTQTLSLRTGVRYMFCDNIGFNITIGPSFTRSSKKDLVIAKHNSFDTNFGASIFF